MKVLKNAFESRERAEEGGRNPSRVFVQLAKKNQGARYMTSALKGEGGYTKRR